MIQVANCYVFNPGKPRVVQPNTANVQKATKAGTAEGHTTLPQMSIFPY